MTYGTYTPNIPRPTYSSIIGTPSITVSSKGRQNQLSDRINDGAMFGPDTTLGATSPSQTGPPYTQSSGIVEAVNYAMTKIGGYGYPGTYTMPTIELLDGNFKVSAQASIQNNSLLNMVIIKGQGVNNTNIDLTDMPAGSYLFNISGLSNLYNFKFSGMRYASNNASGSGGLLKFVSGGGPSLYIDDIYQGTNGFSGYSVDIEATQPDTVIFLLQLNNCQGNYSFAEGWYIAGNIHQVSLIGGNGWMTFQNCFDVTGVGVHVAQLQFISDNNVTLLGCHNTSISAYGTINSITIIGGNTYANYNTIIVPPNQSLTLDALIVDGLTLLDATEDVGFLYFNGAGTVTINNALIRNLNSNNSYTFTYVPLNLPSTPAVPASGTAVQNTNPYPVDVYVYGGTVTEIQITRNRDFNGATYTVFSNSSGLALSGQNFKLNPTDTITITYTTAPTWTWVSAD